MALQRQASNIPVSDQWLCRLPAEIRCVSAVPEGIALIVHDLGISRILFMTSS
jgi:hypothetical protein